MLDLLKYIDLSHSAEATDLRNRTQVNSAIAKI